MASRDLVVHIIGDDRSYQRALKESTAATAAFDRRMSQSARGAAAGSGAFAAMGRSVAFASGTFLGAAGLTAAIKTSSDAASNLAEQTNKVKAVFGDSAAVVLDFGKTTSRTMGIANDQALEAAGTFGNLFNTVKLAPAANARLSTSLVKLAADLASFNNADPSEVLLALRSGLIGEAEPLRRFGVLLSETRVQQEAMRETGKQNARALSDQEKVLARYNLILKDTVPAQGDFAKTSEGLANQQRILNARLRDSAAAVGENLNPAIQDLTSFMIAALDAANKLAAAVNKLPGGSFSGVDLFTRIGHGLRSLGQRVFGGGTAGPTVDPGTEGIRLRGLAGSAALTGGGPTAAARTPRWRASMMLQASVLQAQLAQAELTAGARDDRAVLIRMQNLLRRRIAATRDLKLRTQLYQDLGSIQNQIESIDDQAAQARQDAADKEKAAKQKQLDAEKERLENHRKHIRAMRAAWQEQLAALRAAADTVRGEFGPLPYQPNPAGILGVRGQSPASFVRAYQQQTRQFVGFNNMLARLRRLGAPQRLVEQIRGEGFETGGNIARGLLTNRGSLRALIRSFRERERVVQQIAHADIHARHVVIHMAGSGAGATSVATRRGQRAGVST